MQGNFAQSLKSRLCKLLLLILKFFCRFNFFECQGFRLGCRQILRWRLSCHLVVRGELFSAAVFDVGTLVAEQNEPHVVKANENRSEIEHVEVEIAHLHRYPLGVKEIGDFEAEIGKVNENTNKS